MEMNLDIDTNTTGQGFDIPSMVHRPFAFYFDMDGYRTAFNVGLVSAGTSEWLTLQRVDGGSSLFSPSEPQRIVFTAANNWWVTGKHEKGAVIQLCQGSLWIEPGIDSGNAGGIYLGSHRQQFEDHTGWGPSIGTTEVMGKVTVDARSSNLAAAGIAILRPPAAALDMVVVMDRENDSASIFSVGPDGTLLVRPRGYDDDGAAATVEAPTTTDPKKIISFKAAGVERAYIDNHGQGRFQSVQTRRWSRPTRGVCPSEPRPLRRLGSSVPLPLSDPPSREAREGGPAPVLSRAC
jgi:hypothetical protein